ncbi:MAG TPA: glycolate oxidase subunit GlcE [Burkholderiaceae bacterium]|jgi:glycolate oxidase FAD binding subunit|nr:glycolate oxidase subunit GlcE [Burkholderiaceae bacterium]
MADAALDAIVDRVRAARADRAPLDIRGGATKSFYGEAPRGAPLDMRGLAGISSYEPSELVVTARAGTPLAELEAMLAEKGQCLAFEPPRFENPTNASVRGGTVGGMVAAGLAGPARATAGSVRDHVLGATLLNGRGEVLSFGGQVIKNVAGYDVSRVLAGSLGILGAICEVSIKVLPRAAATRTLRFELDEGAALQRTAEWGGQPLPISASAWWRGMLVVRLAGADAAVHAARLRLGGEAIEETLAQEFWTGLRDQTDEFFAAASQAVGGGASLWRLALPQTAAALGLAGDTLVEWGGAQRWLVSEAPARQVRDAAARAGGHATLFRAQDKSAGVFAPLAPPLARIHHELKRAFDPEGIFNPGRLYPGL